jgi:hypothetical protein
MSLDKAMKNLKFDSRLVEHNLRSGTITKEDLQKHLAQRPDSGANAIKIELEEESNGHDASSSDHH